MNNHHTVTVGQYQGTHIMPYCQYYVHAHIASVYQGNKIYTSCLNT